MGNDVKVNNSIADNSDKNKDKPNDNDSTFDGTAGENEPRQSSQSDLIQFLSKHDLMDMRFQISSSKLKLRHLVKADKSDLDGLCSDFKLSSSQKIRLKHAIKSMQKRKIVRKRIKHKIRAKGVALKNKSKSKKKAPSNRPIQSNINKDNDRKLKSKLVIVGQSASGKTTLSKALKGYQFEPGSKATFAVNSSHYKQEYEYKNLNMSIDYEIFDTPGLDRFADIITLYLRGALAVIVVYDVCNSESFEKAKWWIQYLEDNASGYDKVILIANKIDIKSEDDEKSTDDGECIIKQGRLYATKRGIAFLEVSAKSKENVSVLLSWIDKQSKLKIDKYPALIEKNNQSIQLHESLINGKVMKDKSWMNKLDGFKYSKCCSF